MPVDSPRRCTRLPHALAAIAHSSAGSALAVAERLSSAGRTTLAGGVREAASGALVHGLSAGCLVAAAVAVIGAVAAAALLPAQPGDSAVELQVPAVSSAARTA